MAGHSRQKVQEASEASNPPLSPSLLSYEVRSTALSPRIGFNSYRPIPWVVRIVGTPSQIDGGRIVGIGFHMCQHFVLAQEEPAFLALFDPAWTLFVCAALRDVHWFLLFVKRVPWVRSMLDLGHCEANPASRRRG